MTAPETAATGPFAPLKRPVFAVIWIATVLGNTGTFMRDVASSWLVTDLSASPAAVALVQAAATLPVFLLALPAGVLSDILDRRRFLIAVQVLLAAVSGTLTVLASSGLLTVPLLIGLTFIGGIGAALVGPTWQSIVPELVPRAEIRSAVALNSLGFNIARAIGPAAGGLLLAAFGAALTYGADVLSYGLVIAALLWWPRPKAAPDALAEGFLGAFRAGLRYARASRALHVVLFRAALFFLFASALWSLLPLVARELLRGDAGFYGLLLGAVGAGAILGALVLPRLRGRSGADGIALGAALISATVMAALATAPPQPVAIALLLVTGAAWISALTTFNGVAQAILPNWVRGRALALYLMVFNGAMTLGSLTWGGLAQATDITTALLVSAGGLAVVGLVAFRLRLPTGEADLMPSNHWPEPLVQVPVAHDRGPVLIQIEYRIDRRHRADFLKAVATLAEERRRDGAYAWGVSEDSSDPTVILEWFMVESWAEHLRQHRRVTKADADLQETVTRFHQGAERPVVRHFLALAPGVSPDAE